MAAYASSSPSLKSSYDVFLSFRGIDTRNTFTVHLYSALQGRGTICYRDDKDLEIGEIISPTLLKAIEGSMISIIVLSLNYASSAWCLEELTKILECKETKQQIVLPVFYHVNPLVVRHQKGSFGEAWAKHQERFKEDLKVQKWKKSLQEVANLSGLHLEHGDESDFIQKIIYWVDSKIVTSTYLLKVAENPIGLESHVKVLNTHLRISRINDITLMIGIYGIGGIGKTTVAKAVYNSIAHQFEARCFLSNVRELATHDGLIKLQERLLKELLGNSRSLNVGSVGGSNVIKRRLCSKRVLLILDDVNELHQLKELAGDRNWFGPGSRIIITTRDKGLLTWVDSMYEVKGLDDNQATELFSLHAFERNEPFESYVTLTKCIIGYAKGLPIALTVLGSYLHGRSIPEWESALKKYERNPDKQIYQMLRISYDGLDYNEKDIFLDIACFFKGKHVKYVMEILDRCGFSSTIGIARLRDKCLINIGKFDNIVEMHDLLQEMGKEVVRQESLKEVGKRSRLWCHEDVRHVLEENTGTGNIEGISLDFPGGHDRICLHPEAFMEMKNLRLFINHNAQISGVPNYLSNQIRVFCWSTYSSSSLPSKFYGNNLFTFGMRHGLVKKLDGLKLKNLTEMDLSYSKFLTKIPDLSSSSNLKQLNLQYCEKLVKVHRSVGFLEKLSDFLVNGCCKLRIFPKRFRLRSLSSFQLYDCSSLRDFPEIKCEMVFLYDLCLRGTSITELPSSIENLTELRSLDLNNTDIKELPSSIGKLTKLEYLSARGCKNLVHLPSSIDQLHRLCSLRLDGCSQSINIGKVEEDGTHESTPSDGSSSSANSASLVLSLRTCRLSESNFFTNANYFPALVELDLTGSDIVIFPQGVRFAGLRHLCLNNCKQLRKIQPLPLSMTKVEARGCTSLKSFAQVSKIFFNNNGRDSSCLKIDLYGCHKLLVKMRIPSWEERHSNEQNGEDHHSKARIMGIIFSGKRIPSWFSYWREANDSNWCEIDINGPHYCSDIEEIILCVVIGFRVGIIKPGMEETEICVRIHDGWLWHDLCTQRIRFDWTDSDHVWMGCSLLTYDEADLSRFRFECDSELVVFRSVGVHLVKKHEKKARDDTGVLHENDVGAPVKKLKVG